MAQEMLTKASGNIHSEHSIHTDAERTVNRGLPFSPLMPVTTHDTT